MDSETSHFVEQRHLTRYLSPISVWALSFGCAVGWGAFVMPGTTFLPMAGPLGTAIGIAIGAAVMLLIGVNYSYLMNKYPDAGGTLTYATRAFGYDHGFLSSWFLMLVYAAIIWANASALPLIGRYLFPGVFQFGFHYQILGYEVWLGETLLSLAAVALCGFVSIYGKSLAVRLQVVLALCLFVGVTLCAVLVLPNRESVSPAFSPADEPSLGQIMNIIALSPWAFAGFESVSQSTAGFKFRPKKAIWIMAAALLTGAVTYILLSGIAIARIPEGYADWTAYTGSLGNLEGIRGLPTFHTIYAALGGTGLAILGVAVFAAIMTGLLGNSIAASRLMYTMAEDGILPKWFGELNENNTPRNALLFLMAVSVVIPFLGRTAIGWIVDVNTIGATIAYAYTSAAALSTARKEGKGPIRFTGAFGVIISAVFFFYFMAWNAGAMATESYLILAAWSILGFVFFRYVFKKDQKRRFGKSTVVWIALLFLIFFTSLMWVRQATEDMTETIVENISLYYEDRNAISDPEIVADTERYLAEQMELASRAQTRNSAIQMCLNAASLLIMFSIYNIMSKREKQSEADKVRAEESSKAKTVFLSNMSHDIRTPMNAIIGYTNLAMREGTGEAEMREFLEKIDSSSHHLLALINDVLEMSRIESGKMNLEIVPVDLKKTFGEIRDMFATQMKEKKIDFTVDTAHIKRRNVRCDKNRLNRVLLNLLSNACKFTPEGGTISVTVWEVDSGEADHGSYEIRVKDSGIGMTPEFAARVFDAFERERNSTVSGIQGTGLGMAITKNIVDLMGGAIDVNTAPGQGTEFIVRIRLELVEEAEAAETKEEEQETPDFTGMRLLLAEDNEINREIASMILEEAGFTLDTAENGRDAVEKLSAAAPGRYAAVLMDIQMPVMNGYDAARAIRRLNDPEKARIPIIAMTANAFSEDIKAAEDAGMDGHVAKPINVSVMLQALTDVLRRKRA